MGTIDYYTSLARRLAPGDLARVAAKRALRAVNQVLVRRSYGVTREQLLTAFSASSPAELAVSALEHRGGFGWCEAVQRSRVLWTLDQLPGARERALARADHALAQRFRFFGTEVCFGDKLVDWFLDPLSGHRYPLLPVGRFAETVKGSDPKFPWAIGRLDQLVALAQGHWVSGAPKYARAFVRQLSDFVRANPVGVGIQWACPMEVALRGANIAQALLMFAGAQPLAEGDFLSRALIAVSQHADYVEQNLEDQGAVPNNHLVANHVGLLVMALSFPELPSSARQVALAAQGLRDQMRAQVHPDGVSFEGSVPYHRLAVELFTLGHVTALAHGVDLGFEYGRRLERMFHVVAAYTSDKGLAPQIGDNDSGRVFPLRDRESLDHGYLLPLGAALFGAPELKREGEVFSDEAAWLTADRGLKRWSRLRAQRHTDGLRSDAGGLHVLRGAGAVLTVVAGPNGQRGVGGHSHNDKGSFELHLDGAPVIVDPGSPTYTRDPELRNAFRRTAAHNVVQVDGLEQAPIDEHRLFALPEAARARVERFEPGEEIDRLEISHRGFSTPERFVEVGRAFTLDKKERVLAVTEVANGEGVHSLVLSLHLPDRQARIRPLTDAERSRVARVADTFGGAAVELGSADCVKALVVFEEGLQPALEPSSYSPGYGELRESLSIVVRTRRTAPGRLGWWVLFV